MSRPTNKSNTKPKATKSPDLYVYSLTSQFQLSPFTLAGASLTASNLELLENAENKKKSVDEQTGPTCRYCGTIPEMQKILIIFEITTVEIIIATTLKEVSTTNLH